MLSYEGIFFEGESLKLIQSLEKTHLPIVNDEIHLTFKYHPSENEIFNELIGKEIEVEIIGYACDGQNSGFEIKLPDEIIPYYINYDEKDPSKLKKPHITVSINEGAKAVNTQYLNFEKIPLPYKVKGKFGYWIKDNGKEYISYEKYDIDNKAVRI